MIQNYWRSMKNLTAHLFYQASCSTPKGQALLILRLRHQIPNLPMSPTKLLYLENFNLTECEANVLDIFEENDKAIIILDQSCFYPQGGGQPYDQGTIESKNAKFNVLEVRFVDGLVRHIGNFESGNFNKGEKVNCKVNKDRRSLNSKLHSAGHALDMAIESLNLGWVPGKGYHFPDGPYVEYEGNLEGQDMEKLKSDLENKCNGLINKDIETSLKFMSKDQMKEVCHFVPDYLPEGKPARVVFFANFGVPCGGTHVNNLSEIKSMIIRKIKQDGKNIKVGYDIAR